MSINENNQLETKSIPDESLSNGADVISQDENDNTEFNEISPDKLQELNYEEGGFKSITTAELQKLEQIMGPQFKRCFQLGGATDEPLDFISSNQKFQDEDQIMRNKMKDLQKRDEMRTKVNQEIYERNNVLHTERAGAYDAEACGLAKDSRLLRGGSPDQKKADEDNTFDERELMHEYEGWEFYKRRKIPHTMVRRYCQTLDTNYTKNKITVCVHINHIFDMYTYQRKPFMRTMADKYDKYDNQQNHRYNQGGGLNSAHYSGQNSMQRFNYQSQYRLSSKKNNINNSLNKLIRSMGSNQESIGDIQGQTPKTHHNEQDETVDRDRHEQHKIGVMGEGVNNHYQAPPNYYRQQSEGMQYWRPVYDNNYGYQQETASNSRPIKRMYINFDKDIAHMMFGYRVRFLPDKMTSYEKGTPPPDEDQSHKPILQYIKERITGCIQRYEPIEGYLTKQTIVKVLDSENEDDQAEIEKNRKLIRNNARVGANAGNTNPNIRKALASMPWAYDKTYTRPLSVNSSNKNSPKKKFGLQKRFASNTLRFSQQSGQHRQEPYINRQEKADSALQPIKGANQMTETPGEEPTQSTLDQLENYGVSYGMGSGLGAPSFQNITNNQPNFILIDNNNVILQPTLQFNQVFGSFPDPQRRKQSRPTSSALKRPSSKRQSAKLKNQKKNDTQFNFFITNQNQSQQCGFNVPKQVQFNINVAGLTQFQNGQQKYSTNQLLQMEKQQIEQQRNALLSQLSKYPQAYNQYMRQFHTRIPNQQVNNQGFPVAAQEAQIINQHLQQQQNIILQQQQQQYGSSTPQTMPIQQTDFNSHIIGPSHSTPMTGGLSSHYQLNPQQQPSMPTQFLDVLPGAGPVGQQTFPPTSIPQTAANMNNQSLISPQYQVPQQKNNVFRQSQFNKRNSQKLQNQLKTLYQQYANNTNQQAAQLQSPQLNMPSNIHSNVPSNIQSESSFAQVAPQMPYPYQANMSSSMKVGSNEKFNIQHQTSGSQQPPYHLNMNSDSVKQIRTQQSVKPPNTEKKQLPAQSRLIVSQSSKERFPKFDSSGSSIHTSVKDPNRNNTGFLGDQSICNFDERLKNQQQNYNDSTPSTNFRNPRRNLKNSTKTGNYSNQIHSTKGSMVLRQQNANNQNPAMQNSDYNQGPMSNFMQFNNVQAQQHFVESQRLDQVNKMKQALSQQNFMINNNSYQSAQQNGNGNFELVIPAKGQHSFPSHQNNTFQNVTNNANPLIQLNFGQSQQSNPNSMFSEGRGPQTVNTADTNNSNNTTSTGNYQTTNDNTPIRTNDHKEMPEGTGGGIFIGNQKVPDSDFYQAANCFPSANAVSVVDNSAQKDSPYQLNVPHQPLLQNSTRKEMAKDIQNSINDVLEIHNMSGNGNNSNWQPKMIVETSNNPLQFNKSAFSCYTQNNAGAQKISMSIDGRIQNIANQLQAAGGYASNGNANVQSSQMNLEYSEQNNNKGDKSQPMQQKRFHKIEYRASLDVRQQFPATTPNQFIRHKQSSEQSLKGVRQEIRGLRQRNLMRVSEHRKQNNAIGDNLNASSDASPIESKRLGQRLHAPIIIAGQSAFDSIKNLSPKKDVQSTRVQIGASGCLDLSPQILDDLREPHLTVGSGLLSGSNDHFQSQNVGVDQSISLLDCTPLLRSPRLAQADHNFQNRNKITQHSHCVSKKASQCEIATSLPVQPSVFPHHGSMVNVVCQNAFGHMIAANEQQASSRNGLYHRNLSDAKDSNYRALNAPFMPRSGMTSIEHPVLQGSGNAQNTAANRSNIHGSCGRFGGKARPNEGEYRNMKDFLNIQITTEGDFVPQKVKSQSLSPTKLNQSKICQNNGQMILNLNKNMMQSIIKNTNEPDVSCSKQDQPQ